MKKALIIILCIAILCSMSACQKNNLKNTSEISSDMYQYESMIVIESQPESSTPDTSTNELPTVDNATTSNTDTSYIEESSELTTTTDEEHSYRDIVCTKIINFQQVGFSIKNSNTMLFIKIPKEWLLEKKENGYNILNNSQIIGSVSTSTTSSTNEYVNVFYNEITSNDITVTHSIDRIASDSEPSYIRTLCYEYNDTHGNHKIVLTVPYQETDSSAVYKMITETKKSTASTDTNLGLLQINDNRNKILILGNSFIGSSRIGSILQTMCGNETLVEAHARGYAHVGTYTNDADIMQKIRDGNYSAVFICGLYDQEAVSDLEPMINVCANSATKLAIFPAHNENREKIDHAVSLYSDTVLLDWKAEIDNLISTGIDYFDFCINDGHKHSTPLAGYVGAHMIYRAVFNKIPQNTEFTEVSKTQIDLLGEYVSTGCITLLDKNSAYEIE